MEAIRMAKALLEHNHNTVTGGVGGFGGGFEVAKCRCRCWFCPECCRVMGYELRMRLIPVLETFSGLLMVTLTVDPSLFSDPESAYSYMRERRCIGRTVQDLLRWGHLRSRRYFYVVEWQKRTEQAHFHVLLDAEFVPWGELLRSWSKHRPPNAGAVVGDRPGFGTVLISMPQFGGGPVHAARYATKYLTKVPQQGFPEWVVYSGRDSRIRRYSTSRGFWGSVSKRQNKGGKTRERDRKTYAERMSSCGRTVNVFEVHEVADRDTGEVSVTREWRGQIQAEANLVILGLSNPGNLLRGRCRLGARSLDEAHRAIDGVMGYETPWIRGGNGRLTKGEESSRGWSDDDARR
jgi:hypothetical protein